MKLRYFSKALLLNFIFLFCFFASLASETNDAHQPEISSGLKFLENKGQVVDMDRNIRNDIKFKAESNGVGVYIRDNGVSYVMYQPKEVPAEDDTTSFESVPTLVHRVDMNFVGSNISPQTEKNKEASGINNYYLAHCPQGITNVKGYYEIVQKNIYNNVDVYYYGGKQGSLKYDIVVKPGGNPNDVKLEYKGAKEIKLEDQKIKINTAVGQMTEWMPRVYQNIEGKIVDVKAEYALAENTLSFKFGSYNSSYSLIIDPTWVTYCGGAGDDVGLAVTADNNSNSISTGFTSSNPFPTTVGPSFSGGTEAYVLSINSSGILNFCTYFGGSGADKGNGITVDASNNIYITGSTSSAGLGTGGKVQPNNAGGSDAFIAMFNASGVRQWCTYYGGAGSDEGIDLEFDGSGNILLVGSAGTSFPTTLVASTGSDIFLTKFNATATTVLWSTCIGGNGIDRPTGMDVDVNDNIVISGTMFTNSIGFPVTNGSIMNTLAAGATTEGVIMKFNSSGAKLWASFLGSQGADLCTDVATDSRGDIVVTGYAWFGNPITQFSPTAGAFQTSYTSIGGAGYLIKFDGNNNGTGAPSLKWFTYFGTANDAVGVAIDRSTDDIFMNTEVYGNGLPLWGCAHQRQNGSISGTNPEDHGFARFDKNGNFLCDSYIGGNAHDDGVHVFPNVVGGNIVIAPNGSMYLTSRTAKNAVGSWVYPVVNGMQMTAGGGTYEAVVLSICAYSCGKNRVTPSFSASKTAICPNEAINFTENASICDRSKVDWLWSFPGANVTTSTDQNPAGISYSVNGTYSAKLIVKTPCGTDSITLPNYITVTSPAAIISVVNNVSCFGFANGGGTVGSLSGTSPFTYNWSTSGTNAHISGLSAGIYSVTVTDTYGCISTTTLTVTEPQLLTVTAAQTNSVSCFGGSNGTVNTIVNGGTSPYTYLWNNSANTSSISSLAVGSYSVVVTDNYGCTAADQTTISEPSVLSVTVTPIDALCNGAASGSASASASGGIGNYSYSWSSNTTGPGSANLLAGVYTVTVTDINGCTVSAIGNVGEPSVISLTMSATDAHCNQADGSASVLPSGGTPGYNYSWNNVNFSANNTVIPAGSYSVTVTDMNACSITGTVTVSNLNGVVANIASSSPASCNGFCDASATAGYSSGTSPYLYSWSAGGTNANINGLCIGTFSVTITDASGCKDVAVVNITQPAIISSTLQSTATSCFGGTNGLLNITNTTGGTSPYNYQWQSGTTTAIATGLTSGTYSVTVIDGHGCAAVFSSVVSEPTQLIVATSNKIICAGSSVTLTASGSGATPGYTYAWGSAAGGGSIASTVNFIPGGSATYSVVVTDVHGCTVVGYSSVTVNALPVVNFSSDAVSGCGPLCIVFTNQTPNTVTSNWNFGYGSATATGTPANHCFNTPGSFNIALTVTDNNGCSNSLTKNNYITVHPDPIASFVATPNSVSILEPTVYFNNRSVDANRWSWSFGDAANSSSSSQNTSFNYPDTGKYVVTLDAINEFGCRATATDIITILPDYSFFIPNTFTPNKDGKNDVFLPLGIGWEIENYEFYIFNRWGELIFSTNDIKIGWNGSVMNSGETVQQDVYVWKIRTKDINGKRHQYTGHVNLIR